MSIKITIEGEDPKELDAWAMRWLSRRGYRIDMEGKWETTGDFCKRIGIDGKAFQIIRNRPNCPPFSTREGPTGRLIDLKPTDELERFCRLHKRPAGR